MNHNRRIAIKWVFTSVSVMIVNPLFLRRVLGFYGDHYQSCDSFKRSNRTSNPSPEEIIKEIIKENFEQGELIDFVIIAMILEKRRLMDEVGGYPYLFSVIDSYDADDWIA